MADNNQRSPEKTKQAKKAIFGEAMRCANEMDVDEPPLRVPPPLYPKPKRVK